MAGAATGTNVCGRFSRTCQGSGSAQARTADERGAYRDGDHGRRNGHGEVGRADPGAFPASAVATAEPAATAPSSSIRPAMPTRAWRSAGARRCRSLMNIVDNSQLSPLYTMKVRTAEASAVGSRPPAQGAPP